MKNKEKNEKRERKTEKERSLDLTGTLAMRVLCIWYFGYDEATWSVLELRQMGSSQYSGYDE